MLASLKLFEAALNTSSASSLKIISKSKGNPPVAKTIVKSFQQVFFILADDRNPLIPHKKVESSVELEFYMVFGY